MSLEVTGIGRLTKDVELEKRKTSNGEMPFCSISVAFDNGKDKEGNDRTATFKNFDCWGKPAENAAKFIGKGSQVSIKATLTNNNYEKDGQKVYSDKLTINKIEYLSSKKVKSEDKSSEPELPF